MKIIFGIFAHPDDEAFGPAGTLLQETRSGTQIHLITLTAGDAGMNPDGYEDLGQVRLEEWRAAGQLLGATTMEFLGYKDGQLNNLAMIEIMNRLRRIITDALASAGPEDEIEFITLDLNGYTGHIDHIVAARAASFVFYDMKQTDKRFARIRYACLPRSLAPSINTDWIFMEPGRLPQEINETIDTRYLRDDILKIMQAHHTQRSDAEAAIKSQGDALGLNYFIVKS